MPNFQNALSEGLFASLLQAKCTYNPVLWSLNVEFYGSMFVFAFCALAGTLRKRAFVYAPLALLMLGTYYMPFLIGTAFSEWYQKGKKRFPVWITVAAFAAAIVIGAYPYDSTAHTIYRHVSIPGFDPEHTRVLAHTLGAAGIFFCVLTSAPLAKVLSARPLVWLGKVSFSVYLLHFIFLCSISSQCFLLLVQKCHLSIQAAALVSFLFSFPVILLCSAVYEKYVDSVGARLANKLYTRVLQPEN